MTELHLPEVCLVLLIGASGSGKSTFAASHFGRYEVVSSDACRGMVADDENDQSATAAAFALLNEIVAARLRRNRLTVVDATNVQRSARAELVKLARRHDVLPVAIVLDVPEAVAVERTAARADRPFGAGVVRRQREQLRKGLRGLQSEGLRHVHVLSSAAEVDEAVIVRDRMRHDRRDLHGPFDVVGDVHGCLPELLELLEKLGYRVTRDASGRAVDAEHPEHRQAVFVGDLVDRGPDSPGVLRLVMGMVGAGHALAVPGNHEDKLVKALSGRKVNVAHGLETTLEQLAAEPASFREQVRTWCDSLVAHLVLDDGRLVVCHAGLTEALQGRASGRVRAFALYGDTTGETDEFGLPVRYPWANEYRGSATVLYGHTPTPEPEWINNTMCLDTGCVFGHRLTALRYPEREVVQVQAHTVHYEPTRPFPTTPPPRRPADDLNIDDVLQPRVVETELLGRVTIPPENAAGALEVMSRFALHPRHLPYLPPTMAPVATSARPDFLEHPDEAFAWFAQLGVDRVVCEEKHMGSRAVVWVNRPDSDAAAEGPGAVYTRTGRSFFDTALTGRMLERVAAAVGTVGLWAELGGDRLLLDAELLPWSVKAEELLRDQYAPVGAAGEAALSAAGRVLDVAAQRGLDVTDLAERTAARRRDVAGYREAYRRYVWDTAGLTGVQLAPFVVLAGGDTVYADRDHAWHLDLADRLVAADPELFRPTRRLVLDPGDARAGVDWWLDLTGEGAEGMVVKPLTGVVRGPKGVVQPGLKVRGREYLRIVYGPEYTEEANLTRLKERHLGRKRSLALREYALGLESLRRWVNGEPLWRVHEAVFAVLALESEPVDPRL